MPKKQISTSFPDKTIEVEHLNHDWKRVRNELIADFSLNPKTLQCEKLAKAYAKLQRALHRYDKAMKKAHKKFGTKEAEIETYVPEGAGEE